MVGKQGGCRAKQDTFAQMQHEGFSLAWHNYNDKKRTYRKLCKNSLAVAGLQAGQVGSVSCGEADASDVNKAAAVI